MNELKEDRREETKKRMKEGKKDRHTESQTGREKKNELINQWKKDK